MNNALVNTIPHSGTHLVTTILNSFGTSGTFRKGKIGGWSDVFTFEDKQLFRSALSDLLVELGYETSNAW